MAFLLGLPILLLILLGGLAFVIHFVPSFVAGSRHVQNFWWIVLINLFFGWTLIGWSSRWSGRSVIPPGMSTTPCPLRRTIAS